MGKVGKDIGVVPIRLLDRWGGNGQNNKNYEPLVGFKFIT